MKTLIPKPAHLEFDLGEGRALVLDDLDAGNLDGITITGSSYPKLN